MKFKKMEAFIEQSLAEKENKFVMGGICTNVVEHTYSLHWDDDGEGGLIRCPNDNKTVQECDS